MILAFLTRKLSSSFARWRSKLINPELERSHEVIGGDGRAKRGTYLHVGNGAGELDEPMNSTRGEMKFLNSIGEFFLCNSVEWAEGTHES